jgi:uncharacterized protein (DUF362 family)
MNVRCHTRGTERLPALVRDELSQLCFTSAPRSIVIKPNWVIHETDAAFPIRALVTDPRLIEAVVLAVLEMFPNADIVVGDVPLQYADFPLLAKQSGLDAVIAKLSRAGAGRVRFLDLRKEIMRKDAVGFMHAASDVAGDPRGYHLIELGTRSHLEPIAHDSAKLAVNDYSGEVTSSNHSAGRHNYLVSRTLLDCDLFINLPKWKAHQKSAITGALKNVVGLSCDKAYLPHFRRGAPRWGGDEYRDENRWLYYIQTTLRERFQKRSSLAFRVLKPGWDLLKKARRIETRMTRTSTPQARFYVAGGGWFGNDTIWRMIYDLNLVVERADRDGKLRDTQQRQYLCLVDGLISGEGNGPLQPLPRDTNCVIAGHDPFAVDLALGWMMGFESERIPLLASREQYAGSWGHFDKSELQVEVDGVPTALESIDINFAFMPPPGWSNYVERARNR